MKVAAAKAQPGPGPSVNYETRSGFESTLTWHFLSFMIHSSIKLLFVIYLVNNVYETFLLRTFDYIFHLSTLSRESTEQCLRCRI